MFITQCFQFIWLKNASYLGGVGVNSWLYRSLSWRLKVKLILAEFRLRTLENRSKYRYADAANGFHNSPIFVSDNNRNTRIVNKQQNILCNQIFHADIHTQTYTLREINMNSMFLLLPKWEAIQRNCICSGITQQLRFNSFVFIKMCKQHKRVRINDNAFPFKSRELFHYVDLTSIIHISTLWRDSFTRF